MTHRRAIVVALGALALGAWSSGAQTADKVYRIGYLGAETAAVSANRVKALREGLRELGYVEGRNIAIEFRWASGKYDRLPALAAEFVLLKVDAVVTDGDKASIGAKHALVAIPIVMGSTTDPVGSGLVANLSRPGGNITGMSAFGPQVMAKRLELLKETLPDTTRVAVLLNPDNPASALISQAMERTAQALKIEVQLIEARTIAEIESAFSSMAKRRVNAIAIQNDTLFFASAKRIADLATARRLPTASRAEFVTAGGLIGYGANNLDLYRRAAVFLDKIFKGTNPGDIPIEQATRFDLAVNLKTAKALGIKIPSAILVQATKVIE